MIVTADEARKLWCPFARIESGNSGAAINRRRSQDSTQPTGCFCLADGCMVWRWYDNPGDISKRRGRCGLTGHL